MHAGRLYEPVVVVLEGKARDGAEPTVHNGVAVVHAPGSGDDTLVSVIVDSDADVTLVTSDRELRRRAEALGAQVVSPGWLIGRLDEGG